MAETQENHMQDTPESRHELKEAAVRATLHQTFKTPYERELALALMKNESTTRNHLKSMLGKQS
jgi:hypothetical protein